MIQRDTGRLCTVSRCGPKEGSGKTALQFLEAWRTEMHQIQGWQFQDSKGVKVALGEIFAHPTHCSSSLHSQEEATHAVTMLCGSTLTIELDSY